MASAKSPESKSKTSRTRSLNKIGFMSWKYKLKSSKNSKSSSSQLEPGQNDLGASKDANGPIPPVRSASLPADKLAACNFSVSDDAPLSAASHAKGKLDDDSESIQVQGPEDSEHDADHDIPTSMDFGKLNKQTSSRLTSKNKKPSGLIPGLGRRKSTKQEICSNDSESDRAGSQICDKVDQAAAERKFKRRSGRSFRIFRSKSSISSTHESEAVIISSSKPIDFSKDSIESPAVNISELRGENVEAKSSDSRSTIDSNELQPGAPYLASPMQDSFDEDETEGWAQVAAF